jgi:hypothetical protein
MHQFFLTRDFSGVKLMRGGLFMPKLATNWFRVVSLKFVEHCDYVIICDLLTIVYTTRF